MTDYEKEQILQLVKTMLDNGQEYMTWRILNPDWDKINSREAFTDKTYAISIRELK